MVNQYALLVAVAILFCGAGITYVVTSGSNAGTKSLKLPPQVQFKVIDDVQETCHYNWDTINKNFRFDCQNDEGMLEVTLFTTLTSTGAISQSRIYHFEQADPRFTKDLGSPDEADDRFLDKNGAVIPSVHDHGLALVAAQPSDCVEELNVDAFTVPVLTDANWAYEGVCRGGSTNAWSVTYGYEKLFFEANLAGNELLHIGSTTACGTNGNSVVKQTTKSWSANEDLFRTPGNCNAKTSPDFVDPTKIDDNLDLYLDGSKAEVGIDVLQKPYPLDKYIIDNPESTSFLQRRLLNAKEFGTESIWDDLVTYSKFKIPGTNWCGKGCNCLMNDDNDNKGCHGCFNGDPNFCAGQSGTACPSNVDETAKCCITKEYGWIRQSRSNPRSATDVYCRQHDKCHYKWGRQSTCACDKSAYYGYNDAGVTGPGGWKYNGGMPVVLFHGKSPLITCRNWQKKCLKRGWTGFCKKRGWGWRRRLGVPFFFNKYNRGKSIRNGPNNIPVRRADKDHGWCGGSPPTMSPTPAPPTNPPTTSGGGGGGGGGGGCFLHKKNADGDVMTVLVHKDTLEPMSNTESLVYAVIDACDGGDTGILDNHL